MGGILIAVVNFFIGFFFYSLFPPWGFIWGSLILPFILFTYIWIDDWKYGECGFYPWGRIYRNNDRGYKQYWFTRSKEIYSYSWRR